MSGSIFGQVTPVSVPDFGATAARAQGMQANRLAMLAQQRQLDEGQQASDLLRQHGAGLANSDPQQRMNVLAMFAQNPRLAAMAFPQMQALRQQMDLDGPGGAPAGMPRQVVTPAASGAGGFSENGLAINTRSESGGDPNARNPRSSATGPNQFIDGTWMQFAEANPELFRGMSREQILAARSNPALSRQATQWYAGRNAVQLAQNGAPVNDATLGLAHQFDGPVAARIATASPNTPIEQIVGPAAMRANPDLAGQTTGQVMQRFAQRYGGGAPAQAAPGVPAAAPAQAGLQRTPSGRIIVPGFNMDRVERAYRLASGNPAAAAEVERYERGVTQHMQALQLERRGESEPLERVRRPDGTEVLVPRSRAAGMESAPSPRETPGPFGNERTGRALQQIEELTPAIANGTATPEQIRRYGSAVTDYQQEQIRPDGSRVTPRIPPSAPPLDWVAQRYPGFQFNGAQPAQGEPAVPAQAGAAPVMGDAVPAAPALPQAGGSPPLPGQGGVVSRDGAAMEGGTRRQIEEQIVGNQDAMARLTAVQQSFRPEYQTYGTRWSNMWSSLRERGGGRLSPQETERLRSYTQARATALENLNNTIKEATGSAMGVDEAARIIATMPNPGTGLFDGDSPTEFQAKLDRAVEGTRRALIRRHYALSRGLNPTSTGIELSEIPALVDRRGREIEAEIRQGSPDADRDQLRQQVRARLRQEFGI